MLKENNLERDERIEDIKWTKTSLGFWSVPESNGLW